jgi:hypothetical protein
MFANPSYLQLDDGAFDNEDYNQDPVNEVNIIDIGGLPPWMRIIVFDNVDVSKGSSTPMDQALTICMKQWLKSPRSVLQV